jgi:hypothetical protein
MEPCPDLDTVHPHAERLKMSSMAWDDERPGGHSDRYG